MSHSDKVLPDEIDAIPANSADQRFERVVEYAPNAMILISAEGRMEMVNAQTEIIFGYARSELLGQAIEMLVPTRIYADRTAKTRMPVPWARGAIFMPCARTAANFPSKSASIQLPAGIVN